MSTILSILFATHKVWIRRYLILCASMIGMMILLQHVHYTIDVVVAVPMTYLVFNSAGSSEEVIFYHKRSHTGPQRITKK